MSEGPNTTFPRQNDQPAYVASKCCVQTGCHFWRPTHPTGTRADNRSGGSERKLQTQRSHPPVRCNSQPGRRSGSGIPRATKCPCAPRISGPATRPYRGSTANFTRVASGPASDSLARIRTERASAYIAAPRPRGPALYQRAPERSIWRWRRSAPCVLGRREGVGPNRGRRGRRDGRHSREGAVFAPSHATLRYRPIRAAIGDRQRKGHSKCRMLTCEWES